MRSWLILLSGLLIWALHFFLLYAIGEFVGTGRGARLLVAAVTLVALAAAVGAALRLLRAKAVEELDAWRNGVAIGALVLAIVAIVWQGLPILFSG